MQILENIPISEITANILAHNNNIERALKVYHLAMDTDSSVVKGGLVIHKAAKK